MIHYFEPKTMAYTACKKLHFRVKTTDDVSEVTCGRCKEILFKQKGEDE